MTGTRSASLKTAGSTGSATLRLRAAPLLLFLACSGPGPSDTNEEATPPSGTDAMVPLGSVRPSFGGPLHIMDLSPAGTGVVAASYAGLFGVSLTDPASPTPDARAYGSQTYWTAASDSHAWSAGRNTGIGRLAHDGDGALSGPNGRPQPGLEGLTERDGTLYVAAQTQGLLWLDAATLAPLGSNTEPSNGIDVATDADTLWVADRDRGLLTYSLEDPTAPGFVGALALEGSAQAMDARAGVIAVAAGGQVHLIDASDPRSPVLAATLPIEGVATRVALKDAEILAVAAWNDTRLFDITDIADPVLLAVEDATSSAMSVAWSGDTLVVGDWDDLRTYQVDVDARAPEWTADKRLTLTAPSGSTVTANLLVHNEGSLDLWLTPVGCTGAELFSDTPTLVLGPDERGVVPITGTSTADTTQVATCTFETNDPDEPSPTVEVTVNPSGLAVGDPAPDFSVPNLEATEVFTLTDARGEILLLTIFSSL